MRDDAGTVDLRAAGRAASADARLVNVRAADAAAPAAARRGRRRLLAALRRPANWLQLVRFSIVGASGYAFNLAIYAVLVHALGMEYHMAAAGAWIIAGANNFFWNRRWTFRARDGEMHSQALRFLVVSLIALGVLEAALTLLVEVGGLSKVVAQVLALAASTPVNFLGNKLWSFRLDLYSDAPPAQEA